MEKPKSFISYVIKTFLDSFKRDDLVISNKLGQKLIDEQLNKD